jgi:bifunctional DNA-binding transcriptional regulator/antitoxin component of YhaV-PrlF toxin-antitoxin module
VASDRYYRARVEADGSFLVPRPLLDRTGWQEGDVIELTVRDGAMVLTKVGHGVRASDPRSGSE